MNSFRLAQLQAFSLNGSGAVIGATSVVLKSMLDIDGNALVMATDFGTIGYGTLEPGSGVNEEQISFTGLTNNANGTTTLTGVKNVAFLYPYTESSGLAKTHAGSTVFVISNTSGFYNNFLLKADDATVIATHTYTVPNYPRVDDAATFPTINTQLATKAYADSLTFSGAPDASTTQKGIVQLPTQAQVDARTATGSTSAKLALTPDKQRSTQLSDYVADTGSATAYAIAPTPAITSYAAGQGFSFLASHTNTTTTPTLSVSGLAAKLIMKLGATSIAVGDIALNALVQVEYDGTQFQMMSLLGKPKISQDGLEIYAADGGSANTYTAALVPTLGAYKTGLVVNVTIANTSTGASTLNVNGLGAKTIKKLNGTTDITKGDLVAGGVYRFIYDGTNFAVEVPVQYANGILSNVAGNSGNNVITTGFKPRKIRMVWFYNIQTSSLDLTVSGTGSYNAGTYAEAYTYSNNAINSSSTATLRVADTTQMVSGQVSSTSGLSAGTITTLTDTGFTLALANATGATPAFYIMWESES